MSDYNRLLNEEDEEEAASEYYQPAQNLQLALRHYPDDGRYHREKQEQQQPAEEENTSASGQNAVISGLQRVGHSAENESVGNAQPTVNLPSHRNQTEAGYHRQQYGTILQTTTSTVSHDLPTPARSSLSASSPCHHLTRMNRGSSEFRMISSDEFVYGNGFVTYGQLGNCLCALLICCFLAFLVGMIIMRSHPTPPPANAEILSTPATTLSTTPTSSVLPYSPKPT